jgi:hypothetical protein
MGCAAQAAALQLLQLLQQCSCALDCLQPLLLGAACGAERCTMLLLLLLLLTRWF